MDEHAMLTRDLVLRLCGNATEFDEGWLAQDRKIVAPYTAPRDTALIDTIVAAGRAMGVDRLLICRTRAEHAYDPVTEVGVDTASIVSVIRGWGEEPTDLLIAVEDLSAAVLVTASPLTVAAGPDDFVRELAGPDIARTRAEFGEEARDQRDPDLLRAAQRYGCLDGSRHARTTRGPGPDLAEHWATRARSLREKAGPAVAGLRLLRGVGGWAMVVVLLLAGVFVDGVSAAIPIVLGALWLLFQLAWPARSRTVSFATLMRVLTLGAVMIWPIAVTEQAVAGALRVDAEGWVAATYVAVAVEEVGKLVPVLLCRLVARRRFRRFAAVDYLLLAAASGAGFHLAEQTLSAVVNAGEPTVLQPRFHVFTLLPGWIGLPDMGVLYSGHAVTTGLIGVALGLAIVGRRRCGAWLWALPVLAVWVAVVEHLAYNSFQADAEPTTGTGVLFAVFGNGELTRWLLLVLLVAAVVLDYRMAQQAADSTPPLPGDPPLAGLRRWARGRAVRRGVRVPGDIAPIFRRLALAWLRLPVALTTTLAAILHEFAVMLAAAGRGPTVLGATWRLLRERRAYAMGAARAGDRPWRRFPSHEQLDEDARGVASALGLAPAAATAGVAVIAAGVTGGVVVSAALPVSGLPAGGPAGVGAPAYALGVLRDTVTWLGALPPAGQVWAAVAGVAVLSLLFAGWSVPHTYPSMNSFLRQPGRSLSRALGAAAPGQVPYAVMGLLGLLVPKSADRLLRRRSGQR